MTPDKHHIAAFVAIIACSFSLFAYNLPAKAEDSEKLGLNTVVIDPGHGGKDSGSLGQSSSTSEKHLVLSIAKQFGGLISKAYPDVKVVYTRDKDIFIELNERAKIAKSNKADLFISIHCNSNPSKTPYGASVHILGPKSSNSKNKGDYFEKSMSVARRENAVMMLEDNYKTTYQDFDPDSPESIISHSLMWSANYENSLAFAAEIDNGFHKPPFRVSNYTGIHQDVFYLLWATNMPAVLLELGFISNPTDFKYLSSPSGQKEIAQRLFDAFKAYKTYYDGSVSQQEIQFNPVSSPQNEEVQPKDGQRSLGAGADAGPSYYAIQIMGLGKLLKADDPAFKGLQARAIKAPESTIYKYVTSWAQTREEAAASLSKVRKKIPEAFLVKVTGDKVTRN